MKYIIYTILIFPSLCFGQGYQLFGAKTNTVKVQGGLQVDSFFYLPTGTKDSGNIRINGGVLQIKNGGSWVNSGGDTSGSSTTYYPGSGIYLKNDSINIGLDQTDGTLQRGQVKENTMFANYNTVSDIFRGLLWGNGVTNGFQFYNGGLSSGIGSVLRTTPSNMYLFTGNLGIGKIGSINILDSIISIGTTNAALDNGTAIIKPNSTELTAKKVGASNTVTLGVYATGAANVNISTSDSLSPILTYSFPSPNSYSAFLRHSTAYTPMPKAYIDSIDALKATTVQLAAKVDTGTAVLINGNNVTSALSIGTNTNQAVNLKVNNATVATFATSGNFSVANNVIANAASSNNSTMVFSGNGLIIGRTIADANTSFTARLSSNSATGKIIAAQFGSGNLEKWSVNYQGTVRMTSAPNTTTAIRSLVWGIDSTIQSIALDTVVNSSATTLTLSTKGYWSFTGTNTTWTLTSVASNVGVRYFIANKGSANITLNAPTNTLWESGVVGTSTTIAPGETIQIYDDALHWTIYN